MTDKQREAKMMRIELAKQSLEEALKCVEYAGYTGMASGLRADISALKADIIGLKGGNSLFATLVKEV